MSSRIHTPATVADAPAASHGLLEAVNKQLGVVPNMFRMVGNSPAALEGYLSLMGALGKGELSAPTRERIALAMGERDWDALLVPEVSGRFCRLLIVPMSRCGICTGRWRPTGAPTSAATPTAPSTWAACSPTGATCPVPWPRCSGPMTEATPPARRI